jgi:ATP-dependent DNA helicase RecG
MILKELEDLLTIRSETEHVEFKEAKTQFSTLGDNGKVKKSVYGYCVAIGNEGGGHLILGIRNKVDKITKRRAIVGTSALQNIEEVKSQIYRKLNSRIDIQELLTNDGRVVIISVPSRPIGQTFKFYGIALMRTGEELTHMDDLTLQKILNEGIGDFSAEICQGLSLRDLDKNALKSLKQKWSKKSGVKEFAVLSDEIALKKLLLMRGNDLTNAAALLLAKEESLGINIPSAEFIFEWRSEPKKLAFDFRKTWRNAFINIYDDIWTTINARNTRVPLQQGFIESDIWAFQETPIREAILNAFAHREYRNRVEPVFIKLNPETFTIKSPGGFLPGVTPANALYAEGKWRNRLLMEVLERTALVERAGVGLDRIYRGTITTGKGLPHFDQRDPSYVVLNIPTKVKDIKFVYYLQKLEKDRGMEFDHIEDIIYLENIRTTGRSDDDKKRDKFLQMGLIEKLGRGSGMRYILSKNFYEFIDDRGEYTRKKWFNKQEQKALLMKYFEDHKEGQLVVFIKFFENKLTKDQIKKLLGELKQEHKIYFDGKPRSPRAYWRIKENS